MSGCVRGLVCVPSRVKCTYAAYAVGDRPLLILAPESLCVSCVSCVSACAAY